MNATGALLWVHERERERGGEREREREKLSRGWGRPCGMLLVSELNHA